MFASPSKACSGRLPSWYALALISGSGVGSAEGASVGAGSSVGSGVDTPVGTAVGAGAAVGPEVGAGACVGIGAGACVGAELGAGAVVVGVRVGSGASVGVLGPGFGAGALVGSVAGVVTSGKRFCTFVSSTAPPQAMSEEQIRAPAVNRNKFIWIPLKFCY